MLLAGSAIVLLAVLAVRGSVRVGLPSLLIYLGMGIILGEAVLGIRFDDASTAQALGFAALVVILTEGGLTTRWSEVRPSLGVGLALATVGVGVSVCLVAVFAHFALDLSWQLSFLLGAITSPTDAAAVFTVLRRVPLKPSLLGALEAESGLNDAPTVLLVVLISTEHGVEGGALGFAALVVYELRRGCCAGRRRRLARRDAAETSGASRLRPLPDQRAGDRRPVVLRLGGRACQRLRRGLRHRADPGELRAAAPLLDPVLRRGPGLAGADRAVHHARAARVARHVHHGAGRRWGGPRGRADPGRAPAQRDRVGCTLRPAVARTGLHRGRRAARRCADRARGHPAGRTGRALGRDLQRRVRAGRRPHA